MKRDPMVFFGGGATLSGMATHLGSLDLLNLAYGITSLGSSWESKRIVQRRTAHRVGIGVRLNRPP